MRRGAGERHQRRPAVPGPRRAVAARRRAGSQPRHRRRRRARGHRARPARCSRRCGRSDRRSTPSPTCPAASVVDLQLDPEAPTAVYANSVLLARLPAASRRGAGRGRRRRDRGRSCSSSSCASSAEPCRARPRAAVRWTGWTARSWCSAWGSTQGAGWAAVREDADRVMDALQPWTTGSAYLLMADADVDEQRGWPASSWQRLVDVRAAADPDGLFLSPHPAGASRAERRRLKSTASSSQDPGSTVVLPHHTKTRRNHDHRRHRRTRSRPARLRRAGRLTQGTVAVPGDAAYDALVSPWNLAIPVRPAAVVAAETAQDVVEAVRFAAGTACGSPRRPPATARWPSSSPSCSSPPAASTSSSSTPRAGPGSGPA